MSKSTENIEKSLTSLKSSEFEKKPSEITKMLPKKNIFLMNFNLLPSYIVFRVLFVHPWCLYWRKNIFDLNITIKGSIILLYFAEFLTIMLTLGLLYRSSNFELDLKMWENFQSNLPVQCEIPYVAKCKIDQHSVLSWTLISKLWKSLAFVLLFLF